MNLVLDLGNSYGKVAVCEGAEVIESAVYPVVGMKEISYFIASYSEIKGAIFSSVVNHSREIIDYLSTTFDIFLELNADTPLPVKNHYKTPDTLGYDRIAAVAGAHTIYPASNVLVIDAGTALTYDLVTAEGEYLGGNISPGMNMRFKALNKFTNRLPLLSAGEEKIDLLGTTTDEAIISGVVNGVLMEIDGFISAVSQDYKDLKVVITGGDANSFDKKLKNSIFVVSHLNLIGLNRILDYNAAKKNKE
ncbi:type III pantothenate kinase [Bacteroidota bacterium]